MSTPELAWFKSSYSSGSGDDCVEVALRPDAIHVRDSKNPQGPQLALDSAAWADFLTYARSRPGGRAR
ncbi:DUF397 domain-containing protein [Streptomyces flavofungini]|uniref:DUF397 domain-containing protein n=1 Tax=Streptomyces flavofungini TaxID=68200 RepID=UPI0025AFD816|nr:DUF397 domain-containing protein [Streptomyces flavofungini]WJV45405.1 DUF397 domain-containing protein [Streptomyces flavofungini]